MHFNPTLNPYIEKCKEYSDWLLDETNASNYRGKWRNLLNRKKLTVEIGPGNGWFMIGHLRSDSETGYIAIEKQYKRSVKCAEKLKRNNYINTRIIRGRGELLKDYFDHEEIDKIIINFPTPWVKKHHKKHILFSDSFGIDLHKVLKNGGEFHLKSDHKEYIDIVIEKLNALKFYVDVKLDRSEQELVNLHPGYERKWRAEGRDIIEISATKNRNYSTSI